jgi:serine/threonine protein kinase
LVDEDEFAIHSFLSSLKVPQNHTIPILDIIPLELEKVIVLPREGVLSNFLDSELETTGNSLASQLLEGVRFLHEQNVAHLDLKPDNIVITSTMQLKIIDFSVSVRVSELESWIVGYRGTEGWVAPELKNNPDTEY